MKYYFSKTIQSFGLEEAVEKTKSALQDEGFGVVAEIDFQKTLKEKLGVNFKPYVVIEACNPPYALKSLNADIHIGALIPCNLIIREAENGFEISSIDPSVAMKDIDNAEMKEIAMEIREKLIRVINNVGKEKTKKIIKTKVIA